MPKNYAVEIYIRKQQGKFCGQILDSNTKCYLSFSADPMYPVELLDDLIQNKDVITEREDKPLSEREIDVLKLACQELSSKEISEKLFINIRTVNNHRNHINSKIGARNNISLLVYALSNGLVRISADKKVVFD